MSSNKPPCPIDEILVFNLNNFKKYMEYIENEHSANTIIAKNLERKLNKLTKIEDDFEVLNNKVAFYETKFESYNNTIDLLRQKIIEKDALFASIELNNNNMLNEIRKERQTQIELNDFFKENYMKQSELIQKLERDVSKLERDVSKSYNNFDKYNEKLEIILDQLENISNDHKRYNTEIGSFKVYIDEEIENKFLVFDSKIDKTKEELNKKLNSIKEAASDDLSLLKQELGFINNRFFDVCKLLNNTKIVFQ